MQLGRRSCRGEPLAGGPRRGPREVLLAGSAVVGRSGAACSAGPRGGAGVWIWESQRRLGAPHGVACAAVALAAGAGRGQRGRVRACHAPELAGGIRRRPAPSRGDAPPQPVGDGRAVQAVRPHGFYPGDRQRGGGCSPQDSEDVGAKTKGRGLADQLARAGQLHGPPLPLVAQRDGRQLLYQGELAARCRPRGFAEFEGGPHRSGAADWPALPGRPQHALAGPDERHRHAPDRPPGPGRPALQAPPRLQESLELHLRPRPGPHIEQLRECRPGGVGRRGDGGAERRVPPG
mmetsp:Transcript_94434/g.281873  ORF Transcript_94434/g.281873 Transcript_94434/m.281873 type:complete len:291 (+) Transcript_94434:1035-1907(+)